jgi:Leucine-rich repeat (LRR) protein
MSKHKITIYKNDLKFNDNFNLEDSEWESDMVKDIYNDYRKKPKIEFRIKDTELENYEYFDLSNLGLTDELLYELLILDRIKNILSKICYLDLSSNSLTKFPDLSNYQNIIYLSVGKNNIKGKIENNILKEFSCEYNQITKINSTSITKLSASNNNIESINIPNIEVLIISNNKLSNLDNYNELNYLECINNNIASINNLNKLRELYIGSNNLESIRNMNTLSILNCANNPINKIPFLKQVKMIVCSTPLISSKYKINNISKIKNDFLIEIIN